MSRKFEKKVELKQRKKEMELATAFEAKQFIHDAVASGKMSEDVHKSLSVYLQKKMGCDINNWCENSLLCRGEDDVSEQTTHVAAHYIATSYFKIPPGLKDHYIYVKYDLLDVAEPTINAIQDLSASDQKWPRKLMFLKEDEVPEEVLDKEKKRDDQGKEAQVKVPGQIAHERAPHSSLSRKHAPKTVI